MLQETLHGGRVRLGGERAGSPPRLTSMHSEHAKAHTCACHSGDRDRLGSRERTARLRAGTAPWLILPDCTLGSSPACRVFTLTSPPPGRQQRPAPSSRTPRRPPPPAPAGRPPTTASCSSPVSTRGAQLLGTSVNVHVKSRTQCKLAVRGGMAGAPPAPQPVLLSARAPPPLPGTRCCLAQRCQHQGGSPHLF